MKKPVKKQNSFFVYILKCTDNTLYTGYTIDLEHRLRLHNAGQGAKYLRGRKPVKLVYAKRHRFLKTALQEEWKIKQLTRQDKKKLIQKHRKQGTH